MANTSLKELADFEGITSGSFKDIINKCAYPPLTPNKLSSWNAHNHLLNIFIYVNGTNYHDKNGYDSNVTGLSLSYDVVYESPNKVRDAVYIFRNIEFPYIDNHAHGGGMQSTQISVNWEDIQSEINQLLQDGWKQIELELKMSGRPHGGIYYPPASYKLQIGQHFFDGTLSYYDDGSFPDVSYVSPITCYNIDNPLYPNNPIEDNQVGITFYNA